MDDWMNECRELVGDVVKHMAATGKCPTYLVEDEVEDPTVKMSLADLERELAQARKASPKR